jgi:hypothetical protein
VRTSTGRRHVLSPQDLGRTRQWRICFEWPKGSPGPVNVEINHGAHPYSIDESGMADIEAEIVANPTHPMIRALKGARKARIQRPGMGKRGGGRMIYYVALGTDRFYMMAAYPKSERDDLSTEQRRRILVAIESIKKPRS